MSKLQAFQGDVLMAEVGQLPDGVEKLSHLILAKGEATGHKHQVRGRNAQLYALPKTNRRFLQVLECPVIVEHEEHKPITLPIGIYEIGVAMEYNHFAEEARNVED